MDLEEPLRLLQVRRFLELPGMDIPGIAASYGVESDRVKSLADLTRAIRDALSSDRPHLIEISERRLADS